MLSIFISKGLEFVHVLANYVNLHVQNYITVYVGVKNRQSDIIYFIKVFESYHYAEFMVVT